MKRGKGRQWELACHLLSKTGEISAPERVASYNAALSAARGAWIAALKMLKDLHREELRSEPSPGVVFCLLGAMCGYHGLAMGMLILAARKDALLLSLSRPNISSAHRPQGKPISVHVQSPSPMNIPSPTIRTAQRNKH